MIAFSSLLFVAACVDVEARASLGPRDGGADALVGEPLVWAIELDGAGAKAAKPPRSVDLDVGWSLVDGPRVRVDPSLPADERPDARFEWTVLALESGELATPEVTFTLPGGEEVVAPAATIAIPSALGEGEDAPRPLAGFREADDRRVGDPRVALAVLAALFVVPLAAVLIVRRRRRPARPAPERPAPTPREQIAALDAAADPAAAMSALGPLVRRAVDARRGVDLAARTDDEWATETESVDDLAGDAASAAADLVRELAVVRFSGIAPTTFAAREAVERAESLLDGLALLDGLDVKKQGARA
ncbi:MAG: hypothetical protein AAGA20_09510 [Planctomycetota bacterium]